jgi:hypothetical protein
MVFISLVGRCESAAADDPKGHWNMLDQRIRRTGRRQQQGGGGGVAVSRRRSTDEQTG